MYRIDGGPPQNYGGPFDYAVDGEHTLEYRSVDGAGQRRGLQAGDAEGRRQRADHDRDRASPGAPLGADGWYDGDGRR